MATLIQINKRKINCYIPIFLMFCLVTACNVENKALMATDLRCESLSNPIGIDIVNPQLGWSINVSGDNELKGIKQTAYQILVASSEELLENNIGDLADSKKVITDKQTHIAYRDLAGNLGHVKPLESEMRCFWKVRVWTVSSNGDENVSAWSEPAMWSMGLLNPQDWKAKWIGLESGEKILDPDNEYRRLPARMLRREFNLQKKVVRGTAYVCGLGFFDLYMNGELSSDNLMNPALSGYDKRLLYVTFDVTSQLKKGDNAIGVILSNGRFFAPRVKVPVPMHNYGYPRLLFQLHIEYDDGTTEIIESNNKWKVTSDGPIRSSNEYDGEEYDARLELPGWSVAGFNDKDWVQAEIVESPGGKLESQMIEPIRITEIIRPKRIVNPKPGIWMVDFGQAFYGSVRLKVSGPTGTEVKMHTSFNTLPDGTLKYQNDRSALNMDIYTLKGGEEEKWHPRFRGNAIRWVQVEGFPGTPTLDNFEGVVIHTDFEEVGEFTSSNELINQIYSNAKWGTRMQNRSLPMEPDRDERMPWGGHPAKTSESEGWVFNVAKFYGHYLHNYRVHQGSDGSLQEISPPYWKFNSKDIIWPSISTIIPDWLYSFYGDERILRDNYEMMREFVIFTQNAYLNADYTTDKSNYGDWVNAINIGGSGEETPGPLLATAYFYNNCRIVERAAKILGNKDDEEYFKELANKVFVGFNRRFLDKENGVYLSNSQGAYVVPLAFKLVPDEYHEKVVGNLIKDIMETRNGHTSVGLIGMQWQMQVLTDIGYPEVAYKIATRTDLPSWGYMVSKGATTSWELWNTDSQGPGMNGESQKILSGNFEAWCYQTLAGINYDPDQPGFKHVILKPEPMEDLKFVKGSFKSLYGLIKSEWNIESGKFNWDFSIPPNTSATIYVPSSYLNNMFLNGKHLDKEEVMEVINENKYSKNRIKIKLGSGDYKFSSKL